MHIFEVIDKTGRTIRLTKERWSHIRKKHPEVEDSELLMQTLQKPDRVSDYDRDPTVYYYYKYYKNRISSDKFLLVLVKYLNGDGYIISAFYEDEIR